MPTVSTIAYVWPLALSASVVVTVPTTNDEASSLMAEAHNVIAVGAALAAAVATTSARPSPSASVAVA